jgi:membrane protease YdiL (CAAX protease family)
MSGETGPGEADRGASAAGASPPFPSALESCAAGRQAAFLLALFYGVVYGGPLLVGGVGRRGGIVTVLSSLFVGTVMLLAALFAVRRDVSWRESLALRPQPLGSVVGWSLLGFLGIYAANLLLTLAYVLGRGDVQAVAEQRMGWLGMLADVPVATILPLALFAGFWEEIVFRGFLLGRLRAALPAGPRRPACLRRDVLSVGLTALLFGLGHGYQGALGMLQTSLAGATRPQAARVSGHGVPAALEANRLGEGGVHDVAPDAQ